MIYADNPWYFVHDGDHRVRGMLNRHYSAVIYADGRRVVKSLGPGEYVLLMTPDSRATFAWIHQRYRDDGQKGVCCPIFRNEGPALSSRLILMAEQFAAVKWPEIRRMFTYVDPRKVRSPNPGYCFKMAGWVVVGKGRDGKLLMEKWRTASRAIMPSHGDGDGHAAPD